MVKNTQGGNKHKCQARKFTSVKSSNKLRTALHEGEIYGIVTKMLGSGMFYVECNDNIKRLGFIRGKFSGRGKRDNFLELGKWVLIGEREWDVFNKDNKTQKMIKCDLLEVYNELDKEKLKDSISIDWSSLILHENLLKPINSSNSFNSSNLINCDDLISFSTTKQEERERLLQEISENKHETITLIIEETDDIINVDDI